MTTARTANPRRRKTLASDVFTACYSAIMASAAVIDARRKDRRKRELDQEIAQAKSTLADMLERSNARDLANVLMTPYPDAPDPRPSDILEVFEALCAMPADRLQVRIKGRQGRLIAINKLRKTLGVHWVMDPPRPTFTTLTRCEEIVVAEEHSMDLPGREPTEDKHLKKITEMVVILVERIMEAAWRTTEEQAPDSHPPILSASSPFHMLRMLMNEGYPTFTTPHLNPAGTVEQRDRLNDFGLKIMNQWIEGHREPYVAKICHNLLVCDVPPSIQNYNLLILGFAMLGEHSLGQAVVDSFLFMSHLKPTEATCLCLLHHYRLKGDVVGFQRMIKRMMGYDPRGIGLKRRTVGHVERAFEIDEVEMQWATRPDIVVIKGFYVQQAPFTLNMAEAMMEGLLDFGLLHESAKILFVCVQQGWAVSRDLMWRLFNMTLGLMDTITVRTVVQGLLDNIEEASAMLLGPDGVGMEITRQLHYILTVWQAITVPEPESWGMYDGAEDDGAVHEGAMDDRAMYDGAVNDGATYDGAMYPSELQAPETNQDKLSRLTTAVWLNEACDYADKMNRCLGIIQRQLTEEGQSWTDRIDRALRTFDAALAHPAAAQRRTERIHRVAKLDWLTSQVSIANHKIRDFESTICNVLARQTPRPLRRFAHFNRRLRIDKRIELARLFATPGRPENSVAWCFRASRALDGLLKEVVWDALPEERVEALARAQTKSGDVSLDKTLAVLRSYLRELSREKEKGRLWRDPFAELMEQLPGEDYSGLTGRQRRRAEREAAAAGLPFEQQQLPAVQASQGWGW